MHFDQRFRIVAGRLSAGLSVVGIIGAATLSATQPAAALAAAKTFLRCGLSGACFLAINASSGPGIAGQSATGTGIEGSGNTGIEGFGKSSYGVFGQSVGSAGVAGTTAYGAGVYGFNSASTGGAGVEGFSPSGFGMYGSTATGTGTGVAGVVTGSGTGVYGASSSSYGVEGDSSSGYALYGNASGNGTAAYLSAAGGGYGLISYSKGAVAVYGRNSAGTGADVGGSHIGIVSRAPAANGFPIIATDTDSNDLFYVDGAGNVSYHGNLIRFARVPGGTLVKSFSSNSTTPTIEDTGTAQLVGGAATVRLDPTFAASVDAASSYRVFITPGGDTRGLFVAEKLAGGFLVRESQGGHSTVSFDYRIVATAAGQAGQRIAAVNANAEPRVAEPHAPHFSSTPPAAAPHH